MQNPINFDDVLKTRVEDIDGEKVLTRKTFEEVACDDDEFSFDKIKRVEHRLATYRASATRTLGHAALEDLVANPGKDKVVTRAYYGSQSQITNTVRQSHTVGKGDKQKTFFGHSTVVVSNGNEPDLLEAIESIANKGRDLFGSK